VRATARHLISTGSRGVARPGANAASPEPLLITWWSDRRHHRLGQIRDRARQLTLSGGHCAKRRRSKAAGLVGRMMARSDAEMRRAVASMAQKCVAASHQPDAVPGPRPRSRPPARSAGCCRHRFPRSQGPAKHKVKTQWLTSRCQTTRARAAPEGPIPIRAQRASQNAKGTRVPQQSKRIRNP
jgi:hypothetical protein